MRSERADDTGAVEQGMAVSSDVPDLESTADRTIIDLRGQGPLVSAGHYRYLAAQPALPDQVHAGLLVLAFAIRSTFDFVVDGSSIVVGPGAVIVIPPGHVYSTGAVAQTRGELLWLVVGTEGARSAGSGEHDRSISETIDNLVAAGVTTRPAPRESVDLLLRVLTATDLRWSGTRTWRHALCMAALMELAHAVWNADAASQPLRRSRCTRRCASRWSGRPPTWRSRSRWRSSSKYPGCRRPTSFSSSLGPSEPARRTTSFA